MTRRSTAGTLQCMTTCRISLSLRREQGCSIFGNCAVDRRAPNLCSFKTAWENLGRAVLGGFAHIFVTSATLASGQFEPGPAGDPQMTRTAAAMIGSVCAGPNSACPSTPQRRQRNFTPMVVSECSTPECGVHQTGMRSQPGKG